MKSFVCSECESPCYADTPTATPTICLFNLYVSNWQKRFEIPEDHTLQRVGKEHYADGSIGAETPTPTPTRKAILEKALAAVCGERQETHGDPAVCLQRIARLWNAYLKSLDGQDVQPSDVAQMMVLFKVGRSIGNRNHEDNYIDQAGYAAIAGEIA